MPNNKILVSILDTVVNPKNFGKTDSKKDKKVHQEYKQQNELMSQEAAQALKSDALVSVKPKDMESAKENAKVIKAKAKEIRTSDKVKKLYRNTMEYYKEAIDNNFNAVFDIDGSMIRQYNRKFDKKTGIETLRIVEYEKGRFKREAVVPMDLSRPVVIVEANTPKFEEYSFYKGKLYKYEHGEFSKETGKKTHEVFKYRITNGTLAYYYKDVYSDFEKNLNAGQRYEFDKHEKLINYQYNLKNISPEINIIC